MTPEEIVAAAARHMVEQEVSEDLLQQQEAERRRATWAHLDWLTESALPDDVRRFRG